MTLDGNSRVRVMDSPVAAPGTCVICGIAGPAEGRKFIDFGLDLEFFGAIYFCTSCMSSVAEACDYIHVSAYEAIKTLSEGFTQELARLKNENRILQDGMVAILGNRGIAIPDGTAVFSTLADISESSEPESEPDEYSSVEEPGSVSADSDESGTEDDSE